MITEFEQFESVQYRKDEEGFDYCFDGYSDWSEIKDETFQKYRKMYLDAKRKLDDYIELKVMMLETPTSIADIDIKHDKWIE